MKASGRYVNIWNGKRWIGEHVHVYEHVYGPVPQGYEVHHKNGIRDDNRIENLEALPKPTHILLHARPRPRCVLLDAVWGDSPFNARTTL